MVDEQSRRGFVKAVTAVRRLVHHPCGKRPVMASRRFVAAPGRVSDRIGVTQP
jgi:hypothetical protein